MKQTGPTSILLILFSVFLGGTPGSAQSSEWYKQTVVYQIYPRSFQDSDGDGIGDIQGIISRFDYLKDLGIETIWISPFFESPQRDWGYDISDYRKIDTDYGTIEDARQLIREAHARDLKIVFDLVMNHTSDQHPWFLSSSSSKESEYADWYVWADGTETKPPNNWKATIGGSGWNYHPDRNQWYYASFLPFQPDLNYRNPEVKQAMLDLVAFWLNEGVDGFRLDIFNVIYESADLKDNPFTFQVLPNESSPDGFFQKMQYNVNQPETFEFARELRAHVDSVSSGQAFLVGEVFGHPHELKPYLGENRDGLNLIFLFDMLTFEFNAEFFAKQIQAYETHFETPAMPTLVFGNHDRKRYISRIGNSIDKAKLIACFQLTARGVPFIYFGEEIGMTQAKIPLSETKDALAVKYNWIPQFLVNMAPESLNRDECRTPMHWNAQEGAGFTSDEQQPWLPIQENKKLINVAVQQSDSLSLYDTYKKLLALRKAEPALGKGDINLVHSELLKRDVLCYERNFEQSKLLVILNFGKKPQSLPEIDGELLLASSPTKHEHLNRHIDALSFMIFVID